MCQRTGKRPAHPCMACTVPRRKKSSSPGANPPPFWDAPSRTSRSLTAHRDSRRKSRGSAAAFRDRHGTPGAGGRLIGEVSIQEHPIRGVGEGPRDLVAVERCGATAVVWWIHCDGLRGWRARRTTKSQRSSCGHVAVSIGRDCGQRSVLIDSAMRSGSTETPLSTTPKLLSQNSKIRDRIYCPLA
jgi:hypothetical protein